MFGCEAAWFGKDEEEEVGPGEVEKVAYVQVK